MTPLSRSGNSKHESSVESKLKGAIPPEGSGGQRAFKYIVLANYGRGVNQGLIDQIDAGTDDDATKTIKKNIVKAEAHVHTALICTIKEIDPADRTKEIGGPLDGTFNVPNQVDQSGPTAYQVSDSDSVDPSKINLEDEDQISNKLGIDIDQAERILDERIANGNYNNRANLLSRVTELSQNQVDSWYESGLLSFGT